ncbi:MAG: hypothetical protein JNJ77_17325 [Planctomycetia bacterium]|nr:hypothetical protein [Planctomycetia bacterium]
MAKSKSQKQIERLVMHHRRWIQETGEDVRQYSEKTISNGIQENSIHSFRGIASGLRMLATYKGTHGVVSIIDGNQSGWQQVHHSCLLYLWSFKIENAIYRRLADSVGLTLLGAQVACMACYTIVCGSGHWRDIMAHVLTELAEDAKTTMKDYWQERRFEPFVIRLNEILNGETPIVNRDEDFGVFTDILLHWNNERSLSEALVRACDYHCENMDDTGDRDPEFDHAPFDLIPWEILAIQQVRQHTGQVVPRFSHDLASAAVMQVQSPGPVQDEFLTGVEQLFRQYFSG